MIDPSDKQQPNSPDDKTAKISDMIDQIVGMLGQLQSLINDEETGENSFGSQMAGTDKMGM